MTLTEPLFKIGDRVKFRTTIKESKRTYVNIDGNDIIIPLDAILNVNDVSYYLVAFEYPSGSNCVRWAVEGYLCLSEENEAHNCHCTTHQLMWGGCICGGE